MASLNTLRTKGGVIVTIVIFLALLAFLVGDIFSSGSSLFNSRKMRVGEINGKSIGYVDFLNEADYVSNVYKMMWGRDAFSTQEQEMMYNMAWEQLVMKNSLIPGFEKIGLAVSDAEQVDMIDGVYLSPVVTSSFVNPNTGTFDAQMMKYFMSNVNGDDGSYAVWNFLRQQMSQERVMSKYFALISGGFYTNSLEVAHGVKVANNTYSARVVGKDYSSIPDSLVKITNAQIKKYYNDHKEAFKQVASRDLEYVVFDVMPSESDYAEAKRIVDDIAVEFAASDAPMQYATLNSQDKPDHNYYRQDELAPELVALAFGNSGTISGPTLNGDVYTVSRVADLRMMPDTLGAKHILLQKGQTTLADSILTAVRSGSDFTALALAHSQDKSVSRNSGDLGKFTPAQVPAEFIDAAVTANVGDIYVVDSQIGLQVVQLTYKSRPVQKAQLATVTYKIDPSAATIQNVYQKASAFVAASADGMDAFRQAVNDESLSKRTVRIRSTERNISGLENSKELVRWAFNGKKGEVSQIMDIDGDYFVAALVDVKEDGYTVLDQVSDQITQTLRNKEKARMIETQMAGSSIDQVASAAGVEIKDVTAMEWSAFYIPEFGVEPKLIGAIAGAKAGVLSTPVEGATGVYRFVVTDVQSVENVTAESEKVKLNANALYYINERTMQALTEESDVTDMRVKFF